MTDVVCSIDRTLPEAGCTWPTDVGTSVLKVKKKLPAFKFQQYVGRPSKPDLKKTVQAHVRPICTF